jgi:ELWxxDGT repeat protein
MTCHACRHTFSELDDHPQSTYSALYATFHPPLEDTMRFPHSLKAFVLFTLALALSSQAQNPSLVKDIFPGSAPAFLSGANQTVSRDVLNGMFLFSATDGSTGQEIYKSVPPFDALSTGLVKDMTPGSGGASRLYHTAYNRLFFVSPATLANYYSGICRSDGTTQGTSLLFSPTYKKNTSLTMMNLGSSQGAIYFSGYTSRIGNPVLDFSGFLNKSDPLTGVSVKLATGGNYGWLQPVNGTTVIIEYSWPGSSSAYCRLYKSNGTSQGTTAYYNLPLAQHSAVLPPSPHPYSGTKTYCTDGSNIFFEWIDDSFGSELWRTNGTTAGTMRITDINPGAGDASPVMGAMMNGYLYFSANDGTHGWQIWRYPVVGGTAQRVTNIDGGTLGANPMWLTPMGNALYFSAYTPDNGRELWMSNGLPFDDPACVVSMVADINPFAASSNPNYAATSINGVSTLDTDLKYKFSMAVMGDWLYFPADDGTGYALWRSDGTTTEKLGAINPHRLTPVIWMENDQQHSMLLFIAWTEVAGYELWKFDPSLFASPKRAIDGDMTPTFALSQSYPNPLRSDADSRTIIRFVLPTSGHIHLTVHDLHGRTVATLVDGDRRAGAQAVTFHAGDLPTGTYVYRLETERGVLSRTLTLVR